MKIAYFDCFCGAAGDMVVGACLDAGASQEVLRQELEKLDLEGVQVKIEKVIKNGIAASSFKPLAAETDHHHVESGHHHGRTLEAIIGIIERAKLSKRVTDQSIAIFQRLAEAEATVHGLAIEEIHFHEVGMADAIMDIVGAVVALESLGVDKVYCSELVTGRGTVPCAHGILPVPAPATAELIRGVVSRAGDLECELLTPTGAAILTTLAEEFGGMPGMKIDQIGYGAGTRELTDRANVLRVMIGQSENIAGGGGENEKVWVLEANIDDASGELIAHVSEQLMNHGACDVYNTAIMMKKGRPGVKISVICKAQQVVTLEKVLFQESTTFGIRRYPCDRTILERDHVTVNTAYGEVRIKRGRVGGKVITRSVEFSDCQKGAKKHKIAVKDVMAAALAAYK